MFQKVYTGVQRRAQSAGDLLLCLFDEDPVVAGEKLLRCRQKLVRRFCAERCRDPDDLANETLRRVMDSLSKNPDRITTSIEAFISGFATNIIREERRAPDRHKDSLEHLRPALEPRVAPADELVGAADEYLHRCLQRCLAYLEASEREILIGYYSAQDGKKLKQVRKSMARSLGVTGAQLRKLAFNLRARLENHIKDLLPPGTKTHILHK